MRVHVLFLWCVLPGLLSPAESFANDEYSLAFSAKSLNNQPVLVQQTDEERYTVVCFLGAECPVARLYGPRLQKLSEQLSSQGVTFIGVGSNLHDSVEDLQEFVMLTGIEFPLVKDYDNRIADQYSARRTAEVFVLDHRLQIKYHGRIDNEYQPGVKRSQTTRADLKQALEELLAGKPVTVSRTEGVGCLIGRVDNGEVTTEITYAREISRLLQKHCIECHQPGEIGPFSLTEYDEVLGWAPMMVEVLENGRMPPWNADPKHGSFVNARLMPEAEKQVFKEWVTGGMPFGDPEDLPAPVVGQPVSNDRQWQLEREPDLVLPMGKHPFRVPADEFVEYQYYVVDPGFEKETWITEAQVLPGNRSVVHHCIVFVRPPDGTEAQGIGWLTAYVPGQRALPLPAGYARRIPAGSKLVFQMHYTPTGTAEEDLTHLGLSFAEESEVTHELFTLAAINHDFEIPPHEENYPVQASRRNLPPNGKLLAVAPHMHLRGKSFRLFAHSGERKTTLLNVPQYDFNWQHVYAFAEPLDLDDVDRISFVSHFDNSERNPSNPDPSVYVTWGDQTYQEMAIGFLEVAVPRRESSSDSIVRESKPAGPTAAVKQAADEYTDRYFQKFDLDRDDVILRDELPPAIGRFGFRNLDLDQDGRVTREEIRQSYLRRNRS
ncbi:MAG: redoxin domain-containing protein [Planctomycetaceae bacterium]|nr:redoxin domain-containing protein [Planctomycetaceae bacterium]